MPRFGIGDTVRFRARGLTVQGVVKKVNPKNTKVRIANGQVWNVAHSLLRDADGAPTLPAPTLPDFEIGQQVVFGRPNGQQRRGEIVKINLKSVGIETDNGKRWRVSPTLVRDGGAL